MNDTLQNNNDVNKKLIVVWICHFTNEYIQKKLNIRNKIPEFAPWITLGIEEAKKRDDIELHIVSPHRWIKKNIEFSDNNIFYHFFNPGIPFYGRHWPGFFRYDLLTNFRKNKIKVRKYVDKIKPNIIHLHGFENPYYSSSVLQFLGKYPLFVTVQGFITLQLPDGNLNRVIQNKVNVEKQILYSANNFGIRTDEMKNEIQKYNPNANFFWHEYFLNIPSSNSIEKSKEFDIVFFARVSKEKGIEDLIISIGKLKAQFNDIKAAIIGFANDQYLNKLKKLAIENDCLENITFFGFLPLQKDVYKIVGQSKICVLPTYNDIIPGTIIESMFGRIPVVSYRTGGIPDINKYDLNIELVEVGNIDKLSKRISFLLKNEEYRNNLANKAYKYALHRWDNKKALNDIIKIYHQILNYDTKK